MMRFWDALCKQSCRWFDSKIHQKGSFRPGGNLCSSPYTILYVDYGKQTDTYTNIYLLCKTYMGICQIYTVERRYESTREYNLLYHEWLKGFTEISSCIYMIIIIFNFYFIYFYHFQIFQTSIFSKIRIQNNNKF